MNRKERRRYAKKINTPQRLEEVVGLALKRQEQDYKKREDDIIEVITIMTAYTIQYKLGLGKKRLPAIMESIMLNIDSYRTGQLSKEDYETIKKEMKKYGIE